MTTTLVLKTDAIERLDLTPVTQWLDQQQLTGATINQELTFDIAIERDPSDPRELSEIPELRLWFVRLDAHYPWLPLALNWETELVRYAAMLIPHQFSPTEGIQFNPEALEIFVMSKVFVLWEWMRQNGAQSTTKLKFMAQVFGYELDDAFFELLSD